MTLLTGHREAQDARGEEQVIFRACPSFWKGGDRCQVMTLASLYTRAHNFRRQSHCPLAVPTFCGPLRQPWGHIPESGTSEDLVINWPFPRTLFQSKP